MKVYVFVIFAAIFAITPAEKVYCQKKEISKKEFSRHYNKMLSKTENLPKRIRLLHEHFIKDSKIKFNPQETVIEIVSDEKIRIYSIFGNRTTEKIYVGNTEYKKQNNGGTIVENSKPQILFWNKLPLNLDGVRWYVSENVSVDGQNTTLFEYILEKSLEYKNQNTQKSEKFSLIIEQKFWINDDHLLIKSERSEKNERPQSNNHKYIYNYQHDPKIKIDAPTVNIQTH